MTDFRIVGAALVVGYLACGCEEKTGACLVVTPNDAFCVEGPASHCTSLSDTKSTFANKGSCKSLGFPCLTDSNRKIYNKAGPTGCESY